MLLHAFHQYLTERSKKELPGRDAQMEMSPVPLDPDVVLPRQKTDTASPSSVLIPLFPDIEDNLHVILTLRTENIRHAGQISFPGGRRDEQEAFEETALRETEEEIGVSRSKIRLACSITPLYLHRTDSQIIPFVGFLNEKPELIPSPAEVEEVFTVPIDHLTSGKYSVEEEWKLSNATFRVPYWNIHEVPLWGATAMILNELLELYKEFKQQLSP